LIDYLISSFACCKLLNRQQSEQSENARKGKGVLGSAGWVVTVSIHWEQKLQERDFTELSSRVVPPSPGKGSTGKSALVQEKFLLQEHFYM